MPFRPTLISEREIGGWEDCTWCSAVMLGNFMFGRDKYPATRDSYEDLRQAATGKREGNGKGNSNDDALLGMLRLYDLNPVIHEDVDTVPNGAGACIQGLYSKLPSDFKNSTFEGAHNMFGIRVEGGDEWVIADPLRANGAEYQRLTHAQVQKYHRAFAGSVLVGLEGEAYWREAVIRINFNRYKVRANVAVYDQPSPAAPIATRFQADSEVTGVGTPLKRSDPDGVDTAWRAVSVVTKAIDGISSTKIGFVQTKDLTLISTSPDWDPAVLAAQADPSFRGPSVIVKDASAEQIAAAVTQAIAPFKIANDSLVNANTDLSHKIAAARTALN